MPEIWLPYGNVEVPLDIRSENLGELIENNSPTIDHDQLLAKIKDLSLDQEVQLILPEISTNILSLLQVILEMHADSRKIEILCKREDRDPIKRAIDPKEYPINPLGSGVLDLAKNTKDGSKILLSEVGFNPVFGFSGGPLSLAMEVDGREKFVEAYNKEVPSPGDETVVETWEREIIPLEGFTGLEVLPSSSGIQEVFIGEPADAHKRAIEDFKKKRSYTIHEPIRALLLSPGRGADRNLHGSLTALWNSMQSVRDGGTICLVAECMEGLGSQALRLLAEGRLNGQRSGKESVRGREDVTFLSKAISRYNIILISTIPLHYSKEKLGFKTAKGVGDGLQQILEKQGSRTKITVVPDASRTLLKVRKE